MTPAPLTISILIVNYETSDFVRACVDSLAGQTPDYEIIVIDNPSAANDAANLPEGKVCIIRNTENIGYGRALNAGAAAARGEFICILNPDTRLPSGTLDSWLREYKRLETAGAAPGVVAPVLLNDNGTLQRSAYNFIGPLSYWANHSIFAGALKTLRKSVALPGAQGNKPAQEVDWVMGAAMLLSRKSWDAVHGFDDHFFLYAEDTDLCWRLRRAGCNIFIAPAVSIFHSQGDPPPSQRASRLTKLFAGLRIFMRLRYTPLQRFGVETCIACDMLFRIAAFGFLSLLGFRRPLNQARTRGALAVLLHQDL